MKDNSREVFITVDRIPLVVTLSEDGFGGYETLSITTEDSIYDIWELIGSAALDRIDDAIEEALREESLQQEMDIAEDRALWRDM